MPSIDDILNKKKKFKKTNYRPWTLLEENDKRIEDSIRDREEDNSQVLLNPISIKEGHDTLTKINANITPLAPLQNKHIDTFIDQVSRLTGHQKKIFFYVIDRCIARGMLSTGTITNESLSTITSTTHHMVKTSINRLITKGLLFRDKGKTGRGGFFILRINEIIRSSALEHMRLIDRNLEKQGENKSDFLRNDTERPQIDHQTYDESYNLDISPLEGIGFTCDHVTQLFKLNIQADVLQESILHFAFDLKNNNKNAEIKSSPLNYFMGILRNTGLYLPPSNYESPSDKALRLFIEKKESIAKEKAEKLEKAINLAFDDWYQNLDTTTKQSLLPGSLRALREGKIKLEHYKSYFKETIWPTLYEQIMS